MNNQNFRITPDLYATKGNRFANYIIDKIIFYVLIFGLSFLIGVIVYSFFTDTTAFDKLLYDIENMGTLMDRLLTSIVFIIFYMIAEIILKGKTVGKYITKTLVVMEDGSKPKASDIVLRSLCRLIPFDAFSFLGAEGRGWHDSMSNTYVVDEKKFKAKKNAQNELDQIGVVQEIE
ncbi:RDD family protein [Wocania ichthyoenteri]|uniref:RDD family protein n=1 Tax=Wocania ichthyoenteri TaxID=1230531 RepID=UPI00068AB9D9|nr:RDD family protein [Wocania ichthyoenteri]